MIHLPTESRAGRLPFGGAQMDVHEEGDEAHAAKFHQNAHSFQKDRVGLHSYFGIKSKQRATQASCICPWRLHCAIYSRRSGSRISPRSAELDSVFYIG